MTNIQQQLQKLEDRFLDGEITEPTFKELRERLLARQGGASETGGGGHTLDISDSVVKGDIRQTTHAAGGAVLGGGINVVFGGGVPCGAPQAMRMLCAICGRRNPEDDTFRCRLCGRDHLCLGHLDKELRCCDECSAVEERKTEQRGRERASEEAEQRRKEEEEEKEKDCRRQQEPDELELDCGGGVWIKFKRIPVGSFVMGSEETIYEKPIHSVTFSQPFFMGVYLVTQAQYAAVMGENPSKFKNDTDRPQHPVEQVSWDDARDFCRALAQKTGHPIRLPSEAEWEYACRAGSTAKYCFGDGAGQLKRYANYEKTPIYGGKSTSPVGAFLPNAWGLYDMHGNVYEWCEDKWHEDYQGAPTDGSPWLSGEFPRRVSRGGAWGGSDSICRAAARSMMASCSGCHLGFRLAFSTALH